ncbi:thiamine pyrophosphate-binding protein, partial [Paenibacillus sp. TAF58]
TGIIPDANPLMLSGLGEGGNPLLTEMFQHADVVLTIETSWWPAGYVPHAAIVIQIAKHQADVGVAVPVDIGVVGAPANIIPPLIEGLKAHVPNQAWLEKIQQCKQAWAVQNEVERNHSSSPLHPASVKRQIEDNIDADAIVALD